LIEIQEDKIVVSRTTIGSGEIVACYSGKDPLRLSREICYDSPAIRPDHAAYLGIELQKAWLAIRNGQEYVQDC
jgi:thymidylate synthase